MKFPSPCGVVEFELKKGCSVTHVATFPSPCGVVEFEPPPFKTIAVRGFWIAKSEGVKNDSG